MYNTRQRQQNASQRERLFGDSSSNYSYSNGTNSPAGSGSGTPGATGLGTAGSGTGSLSGRNTPYDPSRMTDREMLSMESQNDDEISGLHSKVAMLKKITMDIGNEVRESTVFLGDMDQDFGRAGGLLNTTYTRLKVMASTQNGRYMCYMVSFCVFMFFFAYFFIYRK